MLKQIKAKKWGFVSVQCLITGGNFHFESGKFPSYHFCASANYFVKFIQSLIVFIGSLGEMIGTFVLL